MAINTLQNYEAALKQRLLYQCAAAGATLTGTRWSSTSKIASGTLPVFATVSNSANGVVPVAGDTGFHLLQPFSGSGKLTAAELSNTIACRLIVYDRLFHCGPYNINGASTTLASQPSYSSRVPGGTDYTGLQLWLESNNAVGTGPPVITVTYTDQSGNAGASTSISLVSIGGVNGTSFQIPLAAGDSGLSKIESVSSTASGSGTFNLFVARPLLLVSLDANYPVRLPMEETGACEVFNNSAIALLEFPPSTSSGEIEVAIEIASG